MFESLSKDVNLPVRSHDSKLAGVNVILREGNSVVA